MVTSSPSYFVRLGKLSAKVRERALEQSLLRARKARDTTHATVTQMTGTLDLLESTRATLASASQQLGGAPEQLLQRWKEWKEGQPKELQEQLTEGTEVDAAKGKGEVQMHFVFVIFGGRTQNMNINISYSRQSDTYSVCICGYHIFP